MNKFKYGDLVKINDPFYAAVPSAKVVTLLILGGRHVEALYEIEIDGKRLVNFSESSLKLFVEKVKNNG